MLNTNLKHVESDEAFQRVLEENENVMICCGREGPMCLPVYDAMEKLEDLVAGTRGENNDSVSVIIRDRNNKVFMAPR